MIQVITDYFVKQGTLKCFHTIVFKLPFSENDAYRYKHLLQFFQVYSINKKTYTLNAYVDLGVEHLYSIPLLCVEWEQLPKSSGELIFRLL